MIRLIIISFVGLLFPVQGGEVELQRTFFLMGTRLDVSLEAETRERAMEVSEVILQAFKEVDQRWSTWREDSELAGFHRSPVGARVQMSDAFIAELEQVMTWRERTGKAFDPVRCVGKRGIRWGKNWIRRDGAQELDSGGFAKGLALDLALERVRAGGSVSSVVMNVGGQLLVWGRSKPVDLSHPVERGKAIGTFSVSQGSVATSGNSERPGHIVDRRTGTPVTSQGTFTVWAPTALAADCLSTAGFVLGVKGVETLSAIEKLACCFLEPGQAPVVSGSFPTLN